MDNSNGNSLGDPRMIGPRVGIIVPSLNTTTELDFMRTAPSHIAFYATRVFMKYTTPEDLRSMNSEIDGAAHLLASTAPHVVAYACTSGTFLDGRDALARMTDKIETTVECPVVTTSGALIEALQFLGTSRLAIASPYPSDITVAECDFLKECGFTISAFMELGRTGAGIRRTSFDEIFELVEKADHPDADVIFVSCTDLRAMEIVSSLEKIVGKPVLTSNQVTLWAVLRRLGLYKAIDRAGKLMQRLPVWSGRKNSGLAMT